ncbi:hypothetical protein CVU37_07330 [candidate division BRC1 bacterium HGW-BRC1-1]|nr:MAG: hypothetical protein CVU37_07330 [candidate division BRC1 bacterium HGW-BRC1-1]
MNQLFFPQITIVGPGLLGSSLGLAARERGLCEKIVGVGRNQTSLDDALRVEGVDTTTTDLEAGLAEADLVVLCMPICTIVQMLPQIMAACKAGALVTDVGSTKCSIVKTGQKFSKPNGAQFVGCHPMAGSEKFGARFARADLYNETTCYVTKTDATDLKAFAQVSALWRALGTRLVVMRPDRHDGLAAMVSHLPHMIAVSMMKAMELSGEDKNLVRGIIGNGFRDMTRVAAANTHMWVDIGCDNQAAVREALSLFKEALNDIVDAKGEICEDKLRGFLEDAAEYRDFLATS